MLLAGDYFCSCIGWSLQWEDFEELLKSQLGFILLYYCCRGVATNSFILCGCVSIVSIYNHKINSNFATRYLSWRFKFCFPFPFPPFPPQSKLLLISLESQFWVCHILGQNWRQTTSRGYDFLIQTDTSQQC